MVMVYPKLFLDLIAWLLAWNIWLPIFLFLRMTQEEWVHGKETLHRQARIFNPLGWNWWECLAFIQWKNTANIQAHLKAISTLCVQGNRVITGSSDSCIKIWSFVEGNEQGSLFQPFTRQLSDDKSQCQIILLKNKLLKCTADTRLLLLWHIFRRQMVRFPFRSSPHNFMRFQLPFWLLQGRIPKSSSGSAQKILCACNHHLSFFWLILH